MVDPEMVEPDPETVQPGDRFSVYYPLEIITGPDDERGPDPSTVEDEGA
jgi:hypothetical protein